MDAACFLCCRHALYAVHAGLEAQRAVAILALDLELRLFEAALRDTRLIEGFGLPASDLCVVEVHAGELFGKERRLVASHARADFEHNLIRPLALCFTGTHDVFHLLQKLFLLRMDILYLLFGKLGHGGVDLEQFLRIELSLRKLFPLHYQVRNTPVIGEIVGIDAGWFGHTFTYTVYELKSELVQRNLARQGILPSSQGRRARD